MKDKALELTWPLLVAIYYQSLNLGQTFRLFFCCCLFVCFCFCFDIIRQKNGGRVSSAIVEMSFGFFEVAISPGLEFSRQRNGYSLI